MLTVPKFCVSIAIVYILGLVNQLQDLAHILPLVLLSSYNADFLYFLQLYVMIIQE